MEQALRYFSFRGRANRQRYWLTVLASAGLMMLGTLLIVAIPVVGWVVGMAVWSAAALMGLAVAARRLHDRGKSAWWLLPMYLPLVVVSLLSELMEVSQGAPNPVLSLLTLGFSIWILVELGCLRGTVGPNRFGPDPLDPSMAEVFS